VILGLWCCPATEHHIRHHPVQAALSVDAIENESAARNQRGGRDVQYAFGASADEEDFANDILLD
jgi:hypothetical protein